jgi:chemotaxis protein MotB
MNDSDLISAEYKPPSDPIWLITFADLISLLLTFFVLLFSMSSLENAKWQRVNALLSTRSVPDTTEDMTAQGAARNLPVVESRYAADLDYLAAIFTQQLAKDQALAGISVRRLDDRVVISLPEDAVFASGQGELDRRGQQVMYVLSGILRNIGNQIDIQGHTDPQPLRAAQFASNWELSLTRAGSVASALMRAGYMREPAVLGFADARFDEVTPGKSEEERRKLARRVDIVIRPFRAETVRGTP